MSANLRVDERADSPDGKAAAMLRRRRALKHSRGLLEMARAMHGGKFDRPVKSLTPAEIADEAAAISAEMSDPAWMTQQMKAHGYEVEVVDLRDLADD